jgi:hypothetical protein
MKVVGRVLARALRNREQEPELHRIADEVREITSGFPLYPQLMAAGEK